MSIESLLGSNNTINYLGAAGFFVCVLISLFVIGQYFKQIKEHKGGGATEQGEWDGIKEYSNPLPTGWTISFILMLIWAIWYWALGYPLSAYSQIGEWNKETAEWNAAFAAKWENPSNEALVDMGKSVFLAQCSQCHGPTADGNNGRAANLQVYFTEGTPEFGNKDQVVFFAKNGTFGSKGAREIGVMPSFESAGILNEKQYEAVATYLTTPKQGGQ
ncbi:MAG: c-type cytochrome [Helicobacteraceae bacterium]|jgi:cytochrome c oxidase cbb3-type subunit 3|nr:c-type cytochrome [Helicobacteraceae bacterium]